MVKIEDIQSYGKEQFEQVSANATAFQKRHAAIANAYGDYAKKSFEETKSFAEKLSGVKSLDKALEAQSDYARPPTRPSWRMRRRSPASTATLPSRPSSRSKAWFRSSRRPPTNLFCFY